MADDLSVVAMHCSTGTSMLPPGLHASRAVDASAAAGANVLKLVAAGAMLVLCGACTNTEARCQTFARRDLEETSTVSGSVVVTWSDGTSSALPVGLAVRDAGAEPCGFTAAGSLTGAQGGNAQSQDHLSVNLSCEDAPPHHPWQLLLTGWRSFGGMRQGDVIQQAQAATLRIQPPGATDRCDDDKTPSAVTLTVVDSVGGYTFADASVSPDYVRNVHVVGTIGPSVCGMDGLILSLDVEQAREQLQFHDSTERACPE